MSITPTSGSPSNKKILQNHHRMVLPEDDPRNNETFRLHHPNVVFEGKTKKNKNKIDKHHSVHRHQHYNKTKPIPHVNVPNGHPAAGAALSSIENPDTVNLALGSNDLENYENDISEGGESFLFHEMMNESFDLSLDDKYYGGSTPVVNGPSDGVVRNDNVSYIPAPTNLAIATVTLEPQISTGDGIATYAASLFFNTIGNDTDYEIRIMKQ